MMHVTYLQELLESRFAVDKRKVLTLNGKLAILNGISISFTNFANFEKWITSAQFAAPAYSTVQYSTCVRIRGEAVVPAMQSSPAYQQLVANLPHHYREFSVLTTHQALQASFRVFLLTRLPNPVAATTQLAGARRHNPASLSLWQAFPWQCK